MKRLTSALAFLLLAACGGRPDDVPVVVSVIGGPAELADPSNGPLEAPERVLMGATAQGLVRFDESGQVEPGLAARWIVIDDGRSYIFRLRDANWANGEKVTAAQVVRLFRRAANQRGRNALAPTLDVVDEVVEMTPQVIEIRLKRPRPDLLSLLAQPELAIFDQRSRAGTGPFIPVPDPGEGVLLHPASNSMADPEDEPEEPDPADFVRLIGEPASRAIARFVAGRSDMVLGGTFADWPLLRVAQPAPANIRVDPTRGLFGLAVVERSGFLQEAANREALAMAIDRDALTAAIREGWPGATALLPDRLDLPTEVAPANWFAQPLKERRETARTRVSIWRAAHGEPAPVRVALPPGPGATLLWGQIAVALRSIGLDAVRVPIAADADLRLVDQVAPVESARWYLETACRPCGETAQQALDAAHKAPPAQRGAAFAQASDAVAADQAFIPLAQPLRWSLVALRLPAWQGNSQATHPLNALRKQ